MVIRNSQERSSQLTVNSPQTVVCYDKTIQTFHPTRQTTRNRNEQKANLLLLSLFFVASLALVPFTLAFGVPPSSPLRTIHKERTGNPQNIWIHQRVKNTSSRRPLDRALQPLSTNKADDDDRTSQIGNVNETRIISVQVLFYGSLALAETIFWYWLAPGIDPGSRWFAPADGALISTLLNPAVAVAPPAGSGLGFSSLLLNSFLILPSVWSLLLLQEDSGKRQCISPVPFCIAAYVVGGGALIPYMIFRKPRPQPDDTDPSNFPEPLKWFEENDGPSILLAGLALVVLGTFLSPFFFHGDDYHWLVEWDAFWSRVQSSQFSALAVFDFTMISITILDPMMDDARRRGFLSRGNNDNASVWKLAPFILFPIIGPVAWICLRPRYNLEAKK